MKKLLLAFTAVVLLVQTGISQDKYFTKKGKISFYSDSPMEKIEAHNTRASSVWDTKTGAIEFQVLITGFEFEKAKMQEHFNENFMESKKFPKAKFKGKITNMSAVDLKKDGTYEVTIEGDLEMHGKTNKVSAKGSVTVKGGKISATCTFNVLLKDYDIKGHAKVADEIKITVNVAEYEVLKKK